MSDVTNEMSKIVSVARKMRAGRTLEKAIEQTVHSNKFTRMILREFLQRFGCLFFLPREFFVGLTLLTCFGRAPAFLRNCSDMS